jgi:hypothetical protein
VAGSTGVAGLHRAPISHQLRPDLDLPIVPLDTVKRLDLTKYNQPQLRHCTTRRRPPRTSER